MKPRLCGFTNILKPVTFIRHNLTFPIEAITSARSRALYAALEAQQRVQYGALIEQQGLPDILCRSPELFFRTDGDGKIEVQPHERDTAPAATI